MQDLKKHLKKRPVFSGPPRPKYKIRTAKNALRIEPQGIGKRVPSYTWLHHSLAEREQTEEPTWQKWLKICNLIWALVACSFLGMLIVGWWQLSPTFFEQPVQNIHYSSLTHLNELELYQASKLTRSSLNDIRYDQVQQDLEANPLVESAQLRALYPNHLFLNIQERQPTLLVRMGNQFFLMDAEQRILKQSNAAASAKYDLPILAGWRPSKVEFGTPFDAFALKQGMHLIQTLHQAKYDWSQIREINVANPFNLKLQTTSSNVWIHVGDRDFLNRIQRFEKTHQWLLEQHPQLVWVDMTHSQQLVIDPGDL